MPTLNDKEISDRLNEILTDIKPKSIRAFALSIDTDPSFFAKIVTAKRPITDTVIAALETKHRVNKEWLLHGKGKKYGLNVPHGKTDLTLHENDPGYGKASYQDKYIALLEKENEQKNKLIELSLTELLMGQRVSQAHLKTLLQVTVTETAVMQGKDPVAALKKANTTVAANYQETLPKGNG